jgi:hypothetical protein
LIFDQKEFVILLDLFDSASFVSPALHSLHKTLFDQEKYADVVFIVNEGDHERRIFFWKALLKEKSDHFAKSSKLFTHKNEESLTFQTVFSSDFIDDDESELKNSDRSTDGLSAEISIPASKEDLDPTSTTDQKGTYLKKVDTRGEGKMMSQIQVSNLT